jgi:hypothetical protein
MVMWRVAGHHCFSFFSLFSLLRFKSRMVRSSPQSQNYELIAAEQLAWRHPQVLLLQTTYR